MAKDKGEGKGGGYVLKVPKGTKDWDGKDMVIREKIFKNLALKSMDAVRAKLREAVLYIERNPELVKSITTFPYIAKSI